jgi:hypothetical protein
MNLSGRLTRAEKAIGPARLGSPARIASLIHYFKTGSPEDIPEDVKAIELQEAARRIPREAEPGLKGLGVIRAALGDKLPAGESVLERIATNPVCVRESRVKDDEKPPADPPAALMARLGFTVIQLTVVITSKAGAISE